MWLLVLSWTMLVVGFVSAASVVVDDLVRGYRQPIRLMELVWPVTALYFGPAAIVAYGKWGRPQSRRWRERYGNPPKISQNGAVVIHLSHCGCHCTIGAIIATATVFAVGFKIAGDTLWPEFIGDYLAAVAVGITFRYGYESHAGVSRVWAAIRTFGRADLLPVSAFEFALFVVLAPVDQLVFPEALRPNNPVFWFILQVGLVIGFFAAWPVSSWLMIRRSVDVKLYGR
jgi:Domain of unknown function (DUF4396)